MSLYPLPNPVLSKMKIVIVHLAKTGFQPGIGFLGGWKGLYRVACPSHMANTRQAEMGTVLSHWEEVLCFLLFFTSVSNLWTQQLPNTVPTSCWQMKDKVFLFIYEKHRQRASIISKSSWIFL